MSTAENRLVVYSAAEKKYCMGLLEGFNARHELESLAGDRRIEFATARDFTGGVHSAPG